MYPTSGFAYEYAEPEVQCTMIANDVTALICTQISFLYLQYFVYKINVFVPVALCMCVCFTNVGVNLNGKYYHEQKYC